MNIRLSVSITDLDEMAYFINNDVDDDETYVNNVLDGMEEHYQEGLPNSLELDDVVDISDRRKQSDTYGQFLGAVVAMQDLTRRTTTV